MTRNSLIFMVLRIAIGLVVALVCARVFHLSDVAAIAIAAVVMAVLRAIVTLRSSRH